MVIIRESIQSSKSKRPQHSRYSYGPLPFDADMHLPRGYRQFTVTIPAISNGESHPERIDMSTSVSRRLFVGGSAAAGLGFVFSGSGSLAAFARPGTTGTRTATGYGPLVADPDGILALPEGFSYKVVARSGMTPTLDGVHPTDPDGMGVFGGADGGSVLVTNHEIAGNEVPPPPLKFTRFHQCRGHLRPGRWWRYFHDHRGRGRQPCRPSTPAWPVPTTTVPAASPRGAPG